jgi:hypothetical protein
MADAQYVETAGATHERSVEQAGTLGISWVDHAAVGAVVVSLFFERLDRSLYSRGSPIPDLTFLVGIGVLSLRYAHEIMRNRVRLARATRREYAVGGFVVPLFVLGIVSVLTLPSWMSSGSQVVKSSLHLAFLAYAAILIGRAASKELYEFALKLYFGVASGAAALAVVQALDLNAGHGSLTRNLHLVYRPHPNGYLAPCSIFSEPAQLGYFMVAALVIGVLKWRSIGPRWAVAGGILCASALLLSFPAGPTLVALVLGLILVFERRPRLSRRAWAGVAALVLVVAAVAAASPVGSALYDRASGIANGSDSSAQIRTADSKASIRIWKIAPATGLGLGNTRRVLPYVWQSAFRPSAAGFNDTEAYLSLLGETGVLGLVAGLLVIAAFIWPATRPVRFATVPQLNTIGVAVSFFVAGTFLAPPLWFWGGLALASARFSTPGDLFDRAIGRAQLGIRQMWSWESSPRYLNAMRMLVLVLVVGVVGMIAYSFGKQTHASALYPVSMGQVAVLSSPRQAGDERVAFSDLNRWLTVPTGAQCGKKCTAHVRYVGGRIWEIRAKWPNGTECLLLNLPYFSPVGKNPPTSASGGPTEGFSGLTPTLCPTIGG